MVVSTRHGSEIEGTGRNRATWTSLILCQCALSLCGASGCTWDQFNPYKAPPAPPPPADSVVLRGDRLDQEAQPEKGTAQADLAGAQVVYRQGDYATAERIFHKIADNTKNSPQVAEEARYYEAECLRRQKKLPKAADTYNKVLIDFPAGAFREQALQHMYEIAVVWLEDTRKEQEEDHEKDEGKRWIVLPSFVHFETEKPLFDEEGRALEKLEQVRYNNMTGPFADKALFLAGTVKMYRHDYKDADYYFTQLVDNHRNSPFAEQALENAIICKQMSTGGPAYDGRKCAEARRLVDTAERRLSRPGCQEIGLPGSPAL